MLATCSVFSPLHTAWKELLCAFKHPVKLTTSQKDNDSSSGRIQGNALSFFPAAFWKWNKALVAVGLHRSPGCRCLRYLPPRGCSPAHTYPEKAQLYKQPLQSWVSADPVRTVSCSGAPESKEGSEFFKWWALFVLPLLFLKNVSSPYGFPYTGYPGTCPSVDGWALCYSHGSRDFRAAVGPPSPSGCSSPRTGMVCFRDEEKPSWPHSHYSLCSHLCWLLFPCPGQSLQEVNPDLSINMSSKASRTIELSCPGWD